MGIRSTQAKQNLGRILRLAPIVLPLALAIPGALLENSAVLMLMVASIALVILLVAMGKISKGLYPYTIYSVALSLLYQTSLFSSGLIGTDIHLEYYLAKLSTGAGWDATLPDPQNSAMGITFALPIISKLTGVDPYIIFKGGIPIVFALVPTILYFVFREWVSPRKACLACLFFVMVPTFFMELPGLARQELAEVFMALTILLIVTKPASLHTRIPLVLICAGLTVLNHYSTGILLAYILAGLFLIQLVLRVKNYYPLWAMGLTVALVLTAAYGYYNWVGGGAPLTAASAFMPMGSNPIGEVKWQVDTNGDGIPDTYITELEEEYEPPKIDTSYTGRHEPLIRTALGLDFFKVGTEGKIFRILQTSTSIFLIAGTLILLRKKTSFTLLAPTAILLLALCIFYPGFSGILNATRFYHITLFALAPAFVVGGLWLCRSYTKLALLVMIPYLLFTTGFIFEMVNSKTIDTVNIPYSVSLSNHRIDLGGSITHADRSVATHIVENNLSPVFSDFFGYLLLQEEWGTFPLQVDLAHREHVQNLVPGSYIFFRERNIQDEKITVWAGIGLRKVHPYEGVKGTLVFKAGDAQVWRVD